MFLTGEPRNLVSWPPPFPWLWLGSWACGAEHLRLETNWYILSRRHRETRYDWAWFWGAKNENNKIFYPQNIIELMCSSGGAAFNNQVKR